MNTCHLFDQNPSIQDYHIYEWIPNQFKTSSQNIYTNTIHYGKSPAMFPQKNDLRHRCINIIGMLGIFHDLEKAPIVMYIFIGTG